MGNAPKSIDVIISPSLFNPLPLPTLYLLIGISGIRGFRAKIKHGGRFKLNEEADLVEDSCLIQFLFL